MLDTPSASGEPRPENRVHARIAVMPLTCRPFPGALVNAGRWSARVVFGNTDGDIGTGVPTEWPTPAFRHQGSTRVAIARGGSKSAPTRHGRATRRGNTSRCGSKSRPGTLEPTKWNIEDTASPHPSSLPNRPDHRPGAAVRRLARHTRSAVEPPPQSNSCINRPHVLFRKRLRAGCAPSGSAWLTRVDAFSRSCAWSTATIFSSSPRSSHIPRHRSQMSTTTPTRVRSWSRPPHPGQSMLRAPLSTGAPNKKTPRGD
jgi:hypothetical protein